MTTAPEGSADFPILEGLRAYGPFPPWRERLMTFGQFVGAWEMDVEYYDSSGQRTYHGTWEWSFAWILGGRAIQDVIVRPDPAAEGAENVAAGTTVRYCDPATSRWTVYFLGAVTGIATVLHGGADGDQIVLKGSDPDGTHNIWTFTDITSGSFTWTGLESSDGTSWWRNQRMLGARRA